MNRRQKIVQAQFLNNEEAVIKRLKQVYGQSLKDITGKLSSLDSSISALQKALEDVTEDEIGNLAAAFLNSKKHYTPEEAKETLQSMLQSKVYQKNYQEALKKQVGGVLDTMHEKEFKTVEDYLKTCYEDGFIGTMYDLQGQGIPLCFPMDQEAMVRAVQLDSKISQGLYSRLGEDVSLLKKKITAQVSRGIATGMTFQQVAQQLAGYSNIGYNNAIRIARTEGHRVQCQATMDVCFKAEEMGADVVKQWDSTLDGKTRESHAAVDGEIKELDEKFSNGLMFPGDPSGKAAEVINCRCALLQRARWALEGSFTKMNNFTKQLETFESPKAYEEFKKGFFSKENKQYMNYVQQMEEKYKTRDFSRVLNSMTDREYKHYSRLLQNNPLFNSPMPGKKAASEVVKVVKVADAKDFTELDNYLKKAYNINVDKSVQSLDFTTVKDALTGVENVISEYPELAGSIKLVTTGNSGVMSCSGAKITFNPTYFTASDKLIADCKRMSESRWWVQNASPASIGAHESAHAIEWLMIHKSNEYQYDWLRIDAWNKCTEAKKLVSQACKNIKKTPYGKGKRNHELIGSISRYGSENASETMAEAFADVYANGENASPLSLEIKRLTAETLKTYTEGVSS